VNIVERGKAFAKRLREMAARSVWDWRQCPHCGSRVTIKNGSYMRHPWGFGGRDTIRVQRHLCHACHQTYVETSPWLVRRSWYYRDVHRAAVDHWLHLGTSLRRTAEVLRSWMGHQERWLLWQPLGSPRSERSTLSASTVHRWLDRAGQQAAESVPGQLAGIGETQELGTDGLWARLKGQVVRVVLMTVDSVSGLIYPPLVAQNEERAEVWGQLLERMQTAGLDLQKLRGLCSDGANGLLSYLRHELVWVEQQRCVWHVWRGLSGDLGRAVSQAVQDVSKEAVEAVRKTVRGALVQLIRGVIDAQDGEAAETALQQLLAHPQGQTLGQHLSALMDRLLVYQMDYCRGLQRVSPEWYWRDFRLRLSHGRNHGSEQRLERAALLWAIYHNFQPAQWRSERTRHYRHPGKSALQVAGVSPGHVSYPDALGV
jgi:transposase-like protein